VEADALIIVPFQTVKQLSTFNKMPSSHSRANVAQLGKKGQTKIVDDNITEKENIGPSCMSFLYKALKARLTDTQMARAEPNCTPWKIEVDARQ
jgi:hypothetical protein